MIFSKPRLMRWGGNAITDHNRSELSINIERIETSHRMANGTLRKYVIGDKRTFGCSWNMLPNISARTVDGFWGGRDMEQFYNTAKDFVLEITEGDDSVRTYQVVFTEFSTSIVKRAGRYDMWDVSVSMEEV